AAANMGAYTMAENYLYTLQAFRRYWQILDEDGLMQIGRWYYPGADRETIRVFIQAYEALAAEGVADPSRHLLVIADRVGRNSMSPFGNVLISRAPFSPQVLAQVREMIAV